jgi:predicted nucleic acid-binding Zn ribbon protein
VRDDPKSLKDLLGPVGERLGLKDAARTGAVWAHWDDIVGPGIAAHCRPSSLREGVLRLRADAPAWATEVGYLSEEIRQRVNREAGLELVFEVKVWVAPPGAADVSPRGRRLSEDPVQTSPGEARRRRDGDPREALARVRAAWAKRGLR